MRQTKDGWKVVTDKGTITCEHVVNAAGLWAKQVGRMAGIELPVSPMKHHYLVSDTIPKLEEIDFEVPMTVDLEGFTYLRQDQKGVLLGIYEVEHRTLGHGRRAVGLRDGAVPGADRPDRARADIGL